MSLFGRRQERLFGINGAQDLIQSRSGSPSLPPPVTTDTAMRNSAVWACLRLRANLVSSMPVDSFRAVGGINVPVPNAPVLVNPGGKRVGIKEWMYSSQVDLDRAGNVFGLITERNAAGLPQRIDLQPLRLCSVVENRSGDLTYRIDGKIYPADQVWHEKQWTVAGLPVGLSPVAYAAWSIGQYQSAQQFAVDWYSTGGVPKGHLRNTAMQKLPPIDAAVAKDRFKAAVSGADLLVSGKDWEYLPFQAEVMGADWLEAQKFGIGDIARFFDCPGDLIDAVVQSGNVTYANVTQRNMQFLTMHLGPAIDRREWALSDLLPSPRFVKLNTSALLRMDAEARARVFQIQIASRTLAPSEARALDDRPPFTPEQKAEFEELFGPAGTKPPVATPGGGPLP